MSRKAGRTRSQKSDDRLTCPDRVVVKQCETECICFESIEVPVGKETAAAILGVSTDTLDRWTAKQGIPHIKYDVEGNRGNKGRVLYLPSEVLAFRERFHFAERPVSERVDDLLDDLTGR